MTDRPGNVTLIPRGGVSGNVVPLRTTDDQRGLRFGVYLEYRILEAPDAVADERFRVDVMRYAYEFLDREERELFAYHWHPAGVSPVRFPHLHLPRVSLIAPTGGSPLGGLSEIGIGKAHFPTGPISLEGVIGLLIRDFGVVPRRRDWAEVLER